MAPISLTVWPLVIPRLTVPLPAFAVEVVAALLAVTDRILLSCLLLTETARKHSELVQWLLVWDRVDLFLSWWCTLCSLTPSVFEVLVRGQDIWSPG